MAPQVPGKCDDPTNLSNQAEAQKKFGNTALFAPVMVLVTERLDDKTITLTGKNKTGGNSSFTVSWGDEAVMWAPCPSSLPSAAVPGNYGVAPAKNAVGNLFLHINWLSKTDLVHDLPKWPRSLGMDTTAVVARKFSAPLRVWPTSIVVRGVELENDLHVSGKVDLLDPRFAKPDQTIRTDGGVITLELTELGFDAFDVRFDGFKELANAIEILRNKDERSSPSVIAAALRIVALCIENSDRATRQQLEMLTAIVPSLAQ
jgi:hypothetical protein